MTCFLFTVLDDNKLSSNNLIPSYVSKSELPCMNLKSKFGSASMPKLLVFFPSLYSSSTTSESHALRRAISTAMGIISTPYMLLERISFFNTYVFGYKPTNSRNVINLCSTPIGNAPEPHAGSRIFIFFSASSASCFLLFNFSGQEGFDVNADSIASGGKSNFPAR